MAVFDCMEQADQWALSGWAVGSGQWGKYFLNQREGEPRAGLGKIGSPYKPAACRRGRQAAGPLNYSTTYGFPLPLPLPPPELPCAFAGGPCWRSCFGAPCDCCFG